MSSVAIDYGSLIVESESSFNEGQMLCPFCRFNYVHHGHIEIHERATGEDGESWCLSTEGAAPGPSNAIEWQKSEGNPSPRRDGFVISFWCESGCRWLLSIYQHKGETFTRVDRLTDLDDEGAADGQSSTSYTEYLKTEHWQAVRKAALERAEHRCQVCNTDQQLNVHHRTYERRGAERDSDVTVLCRSCHQRFHGVTNGRVTNQVE